MYSIIRAISDAMRTSTATRHNSTSTRNTLEKKAFAKALKLFREAASRIPAYKDFLKREKIRPSLIRTPSDFAQVTPMDKANYISRYDLEDLSWDGALSLARYVSTSSGSTGTPFFWPRGRKQDIAVGEMVRRVYEDIFDSKRGSTLFVDSFALGTWIAGLEFYNATRWTADRGSHIIISTPGIDRTEAINQIQKLAPLFDRVVLGGYPPFVKDIIDQGTIAGISWSSFDVRLMVAGEAVSLPWQDKILSMIGKQGDMRSFVNIYGMADAGVVAYQTPFSTLVRQLLTEEERVTDASVNASRITGVYQYDPLIRYFEHVENDGLYLTSDSGVPLIRYDTRDTGGILHHTELIGSDTRGTLLRDMARKARVDPNAWQMPLVYLYGRKDLSITLYALNIYVENIKHALETSSCASLLSGMFTMAVEHTETLDQQFVLTIELAIGSEPSASLVEKLTADIVSDLCSLNSEYAKLSASVGDRARPKVVLVKNGEIQTLRGRKHKWITRA